MRLATLDVGTNTAQLLVAEHDGRSLRRLHAAERFVRLGEGVDAHGRIESGAVERLLASLREHHETIRTYDVDVVAGAGTSALRDASNREAVVQAVEEDIGLSIEILSPEAEATWSFAAACSAFGSLDGSCLVVDIGGGSTELVAGEDPAAHHPDYRHAITDRASLDVGCVRLTERCFSSQPPAPGEIDRAEAIIDGALSSHALTIGPDSTLIGTAGTATALALVHAGPTATRDALHGGGFLLSRSDVRDWRKRLFQQSVDDILALHPDAMAGRADVFPVGVLLLDRIMAQYNRDTLRVSPYELRHGLALRTLAKEDLG